MASPKAVVPVREYGRPDPTPVRPAAPAPDPSLQVAALVTENRRLRDKISRLESMIEDELRMWKRGLDGGGWESREQLRRRLSRLRGAVEYEGNENGWRIASGDKSK